MSNFSDLFFLSKKKIKKNFLFAGEWCLNNHTDLHKRDINIVNRESKRNIVKEGQFVKNYMTVFYLI